MLHRLAVLGVSVALVVSAIADAVPNSLNERVRALTRELLQSPANRDQRSLVIDREAALRELIQSDPAGALQLEMPADLHQGVAARYPDMTAHLETRGKWQGLIICVVRDDFSRHQSNSYCEMRVSGETLEMHFRDVHAMHAVNGKIVSVEGLRLGTLVAVDQSEVLAPRSAAAGCSTTGPQNTAVLLANFPGVPQPNITPSQVHDIFFGTTGMSLDSYWRETSYGKASATGDVFGWFTLDQTYDSTQSTEMLNAAIQAADSSVDLTQYTRIFLIYNSAAGGPEGFAQTACGPLTTPTHGSFSATVSWIQAGAFTDPGTAFQVVAHEGGHNLGLFHAQLLEFAGQPLGNMSDPGTIVQYGNKYSVMGQGDFGHYDARAKFQLGWLADGTDIQEIDTEGTYTVLPLEPINTGIRAMRIRRAAGMDAWIWVEFRQPIGIYDSTLLNDAYTGALVYYENANDPYETDLLDYTPGSSLADAIDAAFPSGVTWMDPYTNRSISIQSASSNGLVVAATLRPVCVTLNPLSNQHGSGSETGSISITASGTCTWGASTTSSWITITSGSSGTGSNTLTYTVAPNTGVSSRQGTIMIGGAVFTVNQAFTNVAPTFQSVSTSSDSGLTLSLGALYNDLNGSNDVRVLRVNFNRGGGGNLAGGCAVQYDRSTNTVFLATDSGTGWLSEPKNTQTGLQTLQNSQCQIVSVAAVPNLPTQSILSVILHFNSMFAGTTNIYASAQDYGGLDSGWQPAGQFTVAPNVCVSLTPSQVEVSGSQQSVMVNVTAGYSCEWISQNQAARWVSQTSGPIVSSGNSALTFNVDANPGITQRTGTVMIGDTPFQITQDVTATNAGLPNGWLTLPVGPAASGAGATYSNGVFQLTGTQGTLGHGTAPDGFQFLYQPLTGDGSIVARLVSVSGSQSGAATGLMLRETVDPNSSMLAMWNDTSTATNFWIWGIGGGGGFSQALGSQQWYKLARTGTQVAAYYSGDGQNWYPFGSPATLNMASTIYAGMFVASNSTNLLTATFDNVSVGNSPDLSIVKTHSGNFSQGETGATYAITVSNIGAMPTTSVVTATDTLPSGLTATAIAGTGWSCILASLSCTRSDALAAGASYPPITVTVNVAANAPATVTNTATVSGGGEVNTSNDTAGDATTITQVADLAVTKSHSGNFTQGQAGATYTITVMNSGAGATTGTVTATDTLPSGLTATAIAGTGWTCSLGTLSCTRTDVLAAGANYPAITVTVNVAASAPATVTNMATVSGGGEVNTSNDTSGDVTAITPVVSDLTVKKSHSGNFTQGQNGAIYTITVSNSGNNSTSGLVTMKDTLPTGLTAAQISGSGWNCSLSSLTCTRSDSLAAGTSYPALTLKVNVAANASASVTNSVAVSGGGETNTSNDSATDVTAITQFADLTIAMAHSGSFTRGQTGAQLSITVANAGNGPSGGTVTATYTLGSGLTATALSGPGWTCTLSKKTCTRNDVLAAGASYPAIALTVNVASNAPSSVTNSAKVSGGGELITNNDSATDVTTIN